MKLSISNIAWQKENDEQMYKIINECGFDAVEVAPTRLIPESPYDNIGEAKKIATELVEKYNIKISSMQSIWFGKQEKIFESEEERNILFEYTKKAIDFANAINCGNLVFGCPKNRVVNNLESDYKIAKDFFIKIGDYAKQKDTIFAIEPNPTIYNTNFINTTENAINIVKDLNHPSIMVNLDLGTMIQNNESSDLLKGNVKYINHVHISEPNLNCIQNRDLHKNVIKILQDENYKGYVSIEMKSGCSIEQIKNKMKYLKNI